MTATYFHPTEAIDALRFAAQNGLPEVYNECSDPLFHWLADFYPNLPWNAEGGARAIRVILALDDILEINEQFRARFALDMIAELHAALAEGEAS